MSKDTNADTINDTSEKLEQLAVEINRMYDAHQEGQKVDLNVFKAVLDKRNRIRLNEVEETNYEQIRYPFPDQLNEFSDEDMLDYQHDIKAIHQLYGRYDRIYKQATFHNYEARDDFEKMA